jgi:probable rRNA maturation factor
MPRESKIKFFYQYRRFSLSHRLKLRFFLQSIFKKEGKKLSSIHFIFCDDAYLLKLNNRWLNHNTYTDIITFNFGNPDKIEGEVYISIERVRENAKLYKNSFLSELMRVMIHGALHLCGYEDKTRVQKDEMRKMENNWLKQYN